jgi:hypothetical protein
LLHLWLELHETEEVHVGILLLILLVLGQVEGIERLVGGVDALLMAIGCISVTM